MFLWFIGNYYDNASIISYYDKYSLNWALVDSHHFMPGSSRANYDLALKREPGENVDIVRTISRKSNARVIYCEVGNTRGIHRVYVPVYNYKGYHVTDEFGNEYNIETGDENQITFVLPDHFRGRIQIKFEDPLLWKLSLVISVLSFVAFLSYTVYRKALIPRKKHTDSDDVRRLLAEE